ncbi:rop guanine nucleotide exchange factor 7-like [Pyrus communis]|uniref:rop guanine nucleotide exchange factor 7-like n=1 Tax=Pyrus communis TaxID=23211 RepID=UPI0035BFFDCD
MNKIQYNKDVGQSILESYSRVMESIAFNIMARIDDLLYVDGSTKQQAAAESTSLYDQGRIGGTLPKQKRISPSPFLNSSYLSIILSALDPLVNQIGRSPGGMTYNKPIKKSNFSDALDDKLQKLTF